MNLKSIAAFAVGPVAGAALGFITLPIIAWFYTAEDIGRIAMLQVMVSFCLLVFSLGLDQAYVREYHDASQKPALLKTSLLPGLSLLFIVLGLCLLMPKLISTVLFSIDSTAISLMVVVCLLSSFVSRFLSLILRMEERGLAYSMSQVLPKLIFLLAIATSVSYTHLTLPTIYSV